MEFLAAPLLWGLTAAGIPVLIHLLARSKPVPHRFPAMRFIIRSQKSSARAMKLKHFLVLFLRILALACLAVGLARPLLGGTGVPALWIVGGAAVAALIALAVYQREFLTAAIGALILYGLYNCYPAELTLAQSKLRGDFVLVMDQSLSMGYVEPDGTRFELARKQALHLLDRLAPDSRVALIFGTETAERAQSRLSFRHEIVRQKIVDAAPTGRGLDLSKSLQAAQEILSRDRLGENASIVLFTDVQAGSINALLSRRSEPVDKKPAAQTQPFGLIVVDVAGEQAPNGAVLSANLPATILPADSKSSLTGKIQPINKNHASLVELFVDGKKVAEKVVEPKGQDAVDLELSFPTGGAGSHAGRLHLTDSDRLMMDQDFLFAYGTGRPASALIIEKPAEGEQKGSGLFLRAALQPMGGDDPLGMSGLTCTVEPPGELSLKKLARHRVVILADCGPLSDSSWNALQQWTAEGGGLFVWLGPNTDASVAKNGYRQHASFNGLLPGNIGAYAALPQPQPINLMQPEHPALAHLTPSVSAVLRDTQVRGLVKITPDPRDVNAQWVLGLPDGTPLLAEKIYGRGRVMLAAIDAGLASSDLPRRGEAFVTLVLDSMRLLSGEDSGARARLGFPFILTLPSPPADGQVLWRKPDEKIPAVLRVDSGRVEEKKGSASAGGGAVSVVVPAIETPGIHTFSWSPVGATAPLSKLVAVNAEPSESNLLKAPKDIALKAFAPFETQIVKNYIDAPLFGSDALSRTREVSAALLLLLFAFVLVESFLSNRLYANEVETEPETAAQSIAAVAGENTTDIIPPQQGMMPAPGSASEVTHAGS
jgi:hypothetical protein